MSTLRPQHERDASDQHITVFVPETKGRSLEDMDAVFGDTIAGEENESRERIVKALLGGNAVKVVGQHKL